MNVSGENTRNVLMIAGANCVHSVVFRQVERLRKSNQYTFSGFGFGSPNGRVGHTDPSAIFDRFEEWPEPPGRPRGLKSAFQLVPHVAHGLLGHRPPWEARNWKERAIDSATDAFCNTDHRKSLDGYDLYHWHYFAPDRLSLLKQLRRNAKVVISLWGSDLYRTAGIREYAKQFEACSRATVFTVATPEMQATFLAKFGHQWSEKVRLLSYGAHNLENIEAARPKSESVLKELGIPANKILVSVGNSAVPGNQHLAALEAIKKLNPELLQSLAIVVPMTYSAPPGYTEKVREAASEIGTTVSIVDQFLSDEAVSALRCSTAIAIHIPISDQFSASMCEALYAGAVLITGSWLPYSRLRSNKIVFHEIAAVSDLTAKLNQVVSDFPSERSRAAQNAKPIWDLMAWERVTPKWLALYEEVLSG